MLSTRVCQRPISLRPTASAFRGSASRADRAARSRGAVRHISLSAVWPEAAHRVVPRALARRRRLIALGHDSPCSIVLHSFVTVCRHDVVWGPAVPAARAVRFQLEGCWAGVLPALDFSTGRLQLSVAEAVLRSVLHAQFDFIRRLLSQESTRHGRRTGKKSRGYGHKLHCFWRVRPRGLTRLEQMWIDPK